MKKAITCIYLIPALLLFAGCKDFLDKEPYGTYTENTFPDTPEGAFKGLIQAYNWLGSQTDEYETWKFEIGDVVSDDAFKGGESNNDRPFVSDLAYFRAVPSNQTATSMWTYVYRGIYYANWSMKKTEQVTFSDAAQKNYYHAEARFLRAYWHFEMARIFGDIPVVVDVIDFNESDNTPRTPLDQVGKWIQEEMEACARDMPLLTETDETKDWPRVTREAALGTHARVALYFQDYETAKLKSKAVIDIANETGKIALEEEYQDIFTNVKTRSKESIWTIAHADTDGNGDGSIIPVYCSSRNSGGWGFNCPTQNLVDEFETGDPRLLFTITETDDVFPKISGKEVQNHTGYATGDGYHSRKVFLTEPKRSPRGGANQQIFFHLLRYADVLLMYAEALYETNGDQTEVVRYINMVRNRASRSRRYDNEAYGATVAEKVQSRVTKIPNTALPPVTAGDNLLLAIQRERRVELAMENHRYYDLKRWGKKYGVDTYMSMIKKAKEHDKNGNSLGEVSITPDRFAAFPLPQQEVDRSGGIIKQNPGW